MKRRHGSRYRGAPRRGLRRADAGVTLFEMLAYTALLAVILNIAMGLFSMGLRLSRLTQEGLGRVETVNAVGQTFQDAVQAATRVVPVLGPYSTGPGQLVLRGTATNKNRFVVFGQFDSDARLIVSEIVEEDGQLVVDKVARFPLPLDKLAFEYGAGILGETRCVTLRFSLRPPEGSRRRAYQHEYVGTIRTLTAAARGEEAHESPK